MLGVHRLRSASHYVLERVISSRNFQNSNRSFQNNDVESELDELVRSRSAGHSSADHDHLLLGAAEGYRVWKVTEFRQFQKMQKSSVKMYSFNQSILKNLKILPRKFYAF